MELGNAAVLFILILVAGFIVGKAGLLPRPVKAGMTDLILYLTLPCMIVNAFKLEYDSSLLSGFIITFVIACSSQAIGQVASVVFYRKQPFERRSVLRYGMIVCNSAFFGFSVIQAVLQSVALPFAAIYLIPQRFAMWLLGVPVFSNDRRNRAEAVKKSIVHPSMIAVYIGLTLFFTHIEVPSVISNPIGAIGGCTMPLSMILVGSILSEVKITMLLDKYIYFYTLLRVAVIPGIIFLICVLFGVTGTPFHVSVLMAGMPAATTTSLLAIRYNADEHLGSALIIISTIFFFVMLPVWMGLFSLVG